MRPSVEWVRIDRESQRALGSYEIALLEQLPCLGQQLIGLGFIHERSRTRAPVARSR